MELKSFEESDTAQEDTLRNGPGSNKTRLTKE